MSREFARRRRRPAARRRRRTRRPARGALRPARDRRQAPARPCGGYTLPHGRRPGRAATRSRSVSAENATLLDDRVRRRDQPRDLDLLAVDQAGNLGRDLVLPVVALVDQIVEPLALGFALEPAEPHVDALVFLAGEAAEDDHAHLDLERDDLLFHALDPLLALSGTDVVLPQLEDHSGLLGVEVRRREYTRAGSSRPCMIRF